MVWRFDDLAPEEQINIFQQHGIQNVPVRSAGHTGSPAMLFSGPVRVNSGIGNNTPGAVTNFRQQNARELTQQGILNPGDTPGLHGQQLMQDMNIWRHLQTGHSRRVFGQDALNTFMQRQRGAFTGEIFMDIEALGDPTGELFSPTEIAMGRRPLEGRRVGANFTDTLNMAVRPDADTSQHLKNMINDLSTGRKKSLKEVEQRTLRDLIKYSDATQFGSGGRILGHADVSNIPTKGNMGQYASKMQQGLDNLMQFGLDPKTAAQQLNEFQRQYTDDLFIGFNTRGYDVPALKQFFKKHGVQDTFAPKNHLDMLELTRTTGIHRDLGLEDTRLETMMHRFVGEGQQAHEAMKDVDITARVFDELERPAGRKVAQMSSQAQEMYAGIKSGQELNQIGTNEAFDTRPLQIGDKMFTASGMKSRPGTGQIARGGFDNVIDAVTGEPITYSDTPMKRNVEYTINHMREVDIEGHRAFEMGLHSPDIDEYSTIVRESPEELQQILHSRTRPLEYMQEMGLNREIPGLVGSHTGTQYTEWHWDTAQRMYRRMFESDQGMKIASQLYGAIDEQGNIISEVFENLTPARQRTVEVFQGRLSSEREFATSVMDEVLRQGDLKPWEQNVAFARAMEKGLGTEFKDKVNLQPWQRQVHLLAHEGRHEEALDVLGDPVRTGARYEAVDLGDPEQAGFRIRNIVSEHAQEGPYREAQERAVFTQQLDDLLDRGLIGKTDYDRISKRQNVQRQVEDLTDTLRQLDTEHPAFIKQVDREMFTPRTTEAKASSIEAANEAADRVMAARRGQLGKAMQFHDDYVQQFIETAEQNLNTGSYQDLVGGISERLHMQTGVTGGIMPRLTQQGDVEGLTLSMFAHENSKRAVEEMLIYDRLPTAGVNIDLPTVTASGHIKHGGLERIPRTFMKQEGSRFSPVSTMEEISDRLSRQIHHASDLVREGDRAEAQRILRRQITDTLQGVSGAGQGYEANLDHSDLMRRGNMADLLKEDMVDASQVLDARAEQIQRDTDAFGIQARFQAAKQLPDELTEKHGIKNIHTTGKEDDVAAMKFARHNVQDYVPFGRMIHPARSNLWQFQNYMSLDEQAVREGIEERGLSGVVEPDTLLATPTELESYTNLPGGEHHMPGLNIRGTIASDDDITRSIDRALERTDVDAVTKRELEQIRHRISTYENMMPIRDDVADLFQSTIQKDVTVTPEQARRLRGTESMEVGYLDNIIDDIQWRERDPGYLQEIIEEQDRAVLRFQQTRGVRDGEKLALSMGEKGTAVRVPKRIWENILPQDTGVAYFPDVVKHGDLGAMVGDRVQDTIRTLKRQGKFDEIERLSEELNQMFSSQQQRKALNYRRQEQVMDVAEDVMNTRFKELSNEQLQSEMQRVDDVLEYYGGSPVRTALSGEEFLTTTTHARAMEVSRHMHWRNDSGSIATGFEGETGLYDGASVGFRERLSLRSQGLDEVEEWVRHAGDGAKRNQLHGEVRGIWDSAQALVDPDIDIAKSASRLRLQEDISPMGRLPFGGYRNFEGTIMKPHGLDPGDMYNLELPVTLEKSLFKEAGELTEVGRHLPGDLDSIPMVARDIPGMKQRGHFLRHLDAMGKAQRNIEDKSIKIQQAMSEGRTDIDIGVEKQRLAKAVDDYYTEASVQMAGKKGAMFSDILTSRMDKSAYLRARGIAPSNFENLRRLGIEDNTAIISPEMAQNILGDDFHNYFEDAIDPQTGLYREKQELFGLTGRYPTIHRDSIQPTKVRVGDPRRWAEGENVYLTPQMWDEMAGDFDDDKAYLVAGDETDLGKRAQKQMREGRLSKFAERERKARSMGLADTDIREQWRQMFTDSGHQTTARDTHRLSSLIDSDIHGEENVSHMLRRLQHGEGVLESKLGKMVVGRASNISSELRYAAESIYGADSDAFRLIDDLGATIEQDVLSAKHGSGPEDLFEIDKIIRESANKRDFGRVQQLRNFDIFQKEGMDEAIGQLESMMGQRFNQHKRKNLHKLLLSERQHLSDQVLSMARDATGDTTRAQLEGSLMGNYAAEEVMGAIGERDFTAAEFLDETLRRSDPNHLDQATDDMMSNYAKQAGRRMGGHDGLLESTIRRIGDINPRTAGAAGIGLAALGAGLYGFQRARGMREIQDVRKQPHPDSAPAADGVYDENMQQPVPESQDAPLARIREPEGQGGLRLDISGATDEDIDEDRVMQELQEIIKHRSPRDDSAINFSVNKKDDRISLDPNTVQDMFADAIRD